MKEGEFGGLFKLTGEELLPLIEWMKINYPQGKGRIIDGNQPFDAEILPTDTSDPIQLEIGFATSGFQDRLLSEAITQDGHGSPNSIYSRVGSGKTKSVKTDNARITSSTNATVNKLLAQLINVAEKKASKKYKKSVILLLFAPNNLPIRGETLEQYKTGALDILGGRSWSVDRVDVVCKKHGLLATVAHTK